MRGVGVVLVLLGICLPCLSQVKAQTNVIKISKKNLKNSVIDLSKKSKKQKKIQHVGQKIKYFIDYDDHALATVEEFFFDDDAQEFQKLDSQAVVSLRKTRLTNANSTQATGVQSVLVVPIADLYVSANSYIYSQTAIDSAYFATTGTSLHTYFEEVSAERISFQGDIANLLTAKGLCQYKINGKSIFQNGGAEQLMSYINQNVDLKKYERVSFVFPDDYHCLGGALGVGTLGKIAFRSPFGGVANTSFSFVKSAGASTNNKNYFLKVITHELGHNLGLKHDNANACGERIFSGLCENLEYGGVHSIMGYSPNLAHANAIHQYDLKWLTNQQVQTLDRGNYTKEFTLVPLAANDKTKLKAIRIKRADGSYYVVEYRQPIGMEKKYFTSRTLSYGGLQIYLNKESATNDSILIGKELKSFSSKDPQNILNLFDKANFNVGDNFNDYVNKIQIIPTKSDQGSITFKLISGTGSSSNSDGNASGTNSNFSVSTSQEFYSLNKTGKTVARVNVNLESDINLTAKKLQLKVPKSLKKLVKVRRRMSTVYSDRAYYDLVFAPSKKITRNIVQSSSGYHELEFMVRLFDRGGKNKKLITSENLSMSVKI